MFSVDYNCSCQSFVDKALCWIAVWIFLTEPSQFEEWMLLEKPHDLISLVVFCMIYEEDDTLDGMAFGISNKVA